MNMFKKAYFIKITGVVQSVGFRPFIYRMFDRYKGWVKNNSNGVEIYLETDLAKDEIKSVILNNAPVNSKIESITITEYKIKKYVFDRFYIKKSDDSKVGVALVPPDLGICDKCAKELFDKNNRRYLNPFINCTDCGVRFSIIEDSPYDRAKTTMKHFKMCEMCKNEYEDSESRRFHAQPISCNSCGPRYFLIKDGKVEKSDNVIKQASVMLKNGKVGLIKGVGGYHLICDALNDSAVLKIKEIKNRYEKPFAVIAKNLEVLRKYCFISDNEESILLSQIKPIVLLKPKNRNFLSETRNDSVYLGAMLPYAPVHLLLFYFSDLEFLVATSANYTEKPLIYKDIEAINFKEADFVLTNNRKILRPIEDSIVCINGKDMLIYRYARGFAPGVFLRKTSRNILALGGDLKNNIAVSFDKKVVLSQYTGDLSEYDNYLRFKDKVEDFLNFFKVKPNIVVCDKHPNYISVDYAKENFESIVYVQHHKAHFASVLFEHNLTKGAQIGVVMDGTGFGDDANIWGGEFFIKENKTVERVGHIKYMPFAFGDLSIKEPFRLAILWLLSLGVKNHPLFDKYGDVVKVLRNSSFVYTSSAGRLFDVASVLLGIRERSSYEAQAAISLTYRATGINTNKRFDYGLCGFDIDFTGTIEELAGFMDMNEKNQALYASAFHNTFIDAVVANVINISKRTKIKQVAIGGGVFQNNVVFKGVVKGIREYGLDVFYNTASPINDGGLALGQIFIADKEYC